ncbi:MAG: helix-turn-helix transcriptional regulator [Elusimicrobiota bacterium]
MAKRRPRGARFKDWLKDEMRDPGFKRAYDALGPEVEFAVQLAKTREKMRLTQKQLAKKARVDQGDISKIENGKQNITLGMMVKLASAVNRKVEIRLVRAGGRDADASA